MIRNIHLGLLLTAALTACQVSQNKEQSADKVNNPIGTCFSTSDAWSAKAIPEGLFTASKTSTPVFIDGCAKDSIWVNTPWYSMNYIWMGDSVDKADYLGRFKLSWNKDFLYVLVEVKDDVLHPTLKDGKENYWKGDYVEVFLDEDRSGGDHKFNHQAFAYHVSTEGHSIDKSTTEETIFLDDHIDVAQTKSGSSYLWEMAIQLFDNQFDESSNSNAPVELVANKQIGFSIAYGDNDGNQSRENFMGSKASHGLNNDEGYLNSDVFGSVRLVE